MSWEDLIFGIFGFMCKQMRVVQGFLLMVCLVACSTLWVCQAGVVV